MSVTETFKRWAYLLMVVLPLLAVVLALCPTVAQAQETNHNNNASADASAERLVVAPGDCLSSISEERLGPNATPQQIAHEVELIYALNRNVIGADPNMIFAGQRLSLPPAAEHQAVEEPSRSAAPAEGEAAARAPAMGGSTAGASAERGSQQRPAGEQRLAGEAAAPDIQEEANPATLPAVAGIAPVSTVRMVAGAPSALEQVFALDGPYAGRKLLGWGIMLVSLLIGAATLAWVAIPAMRRAAEPKRRRRLYRQVYGRPYAAPLMDFRVSSSENPPSEGSREEAARAAPSEGCRRPFALGDHRPRRAWRLSEDRGQNGDWGQKDPALMLNGRRQAMGVNPNESDVSNEEWEIDEPLRRSLEGLPLQPGAPMLRAARELKPHVEEALESLVLLEERRPLSENEHRQADSLRLLLTSIEHTSADNGRR